MPARAPRLCSCGKQVPSGSRCACQAKRDAARKAKFDKARPSSSQRGYTREWERASKAFLERCPYCSRCGKYLDLSKPRAAVVDHKIPHRGDQKLFWDKTNWSRLCTPCHSGAKQREERRHSGKVQQ
ncbi:HNH endonuclease signature motif containing protein [Paracoccus sp. MBLB3053]|uniref:Putative HNH nuclease YajD n=1 Tax=Paracoccus aurantius TaxID=3073814 RepID=A0ABU2HTT8_9RHOB|nr:HNH endonuclease signature motif containing protein [Paracoccus sp. MBLB3053]MDS9467940.1 HNH endonuclease signature motif containing protein [Paracoccus sp. MBLB3053]